jgi:hypothetical protein
MITTTCRTTCITVVYFFFVGCFGWWLEVGGWWLVDSPPKIPSTWGWGRCRVRGTRRQAFLPNERGDASHLPNAQVQQSFTPDIPSITMEAAAEEAYDAYGDNFLSLV